MKSFSLKTQLVEFMPPTLEHGTLYVSDKYQLAIHLCACGCGSQTITPFNKTYGWVLTMFNNNPDQITLRPSIGNQWLPCHSHYHITNNKIEWL